MPRNRSQRGATPDGFGVNPVISSKNCSEGEREVAARPTKGSAKQKESLKKSRVRSKRLAISDPVRFECLQTQSECLENMDLRRIAFVREVGLRNLEHRTKALIAIHDIFLARVRFAQEMEWPDSAKVETVSDLRDQLKRANAEIMQEGGWVLSLSAMLQNWDSRSKALIECRDACLAKVRDVLTKDWPEAIIMSIVGEITSLMKVVAARLLKMESPGCAVDYDLLLFTWESAFRMTVSGLMEACEGTLAKVKEVIDKPWRESLKKSTIRGVVGDLERVIKIVHDSGEKVFFETCPKPKC